MNKLFLALIIFLSNPMNAQLNVKVGYGLGFYQTGQMDKLFTDFNSAKDVELSGGLEQPLSELKAMHGIQLGLRYQLNRHHTFELGLDNQSQSKEALGENLDQSFYQQKLFFSSNQVYLSYQMIFNSVGMGIGIGSSTFKIKDNIATSDIKKTLVDEHQYILRFNLAYYFPGDSNVGFSIQPYYHLAMDDISLNGLSNELELVSNENAKASFSNFGIRFIFYNGEK